MRRKRKGKAEWKRKKGTSVEEEGGRRGRGEREEREREGGKARRMGKERMRRGEKKR